MKLPIYQIDAFTSRLFGGNPAAVVPLDSWLADQVLQAIAAENNLSETAFVLAQTNPARLRWFTPELEVDLCGHATLAAAHVMFSEYFPRQSEITFKTRSGTLRVVRSGSLLMMEFPSRPGKPVSVSADQIAALGARPREALQARDLLLVFDSEAEVRAMRPDFDRIANLNTFAVIVSAPGSKADFVSRFFAPRAGVAEDPVTGSSHCTLIPYWAARLGKRTLLSHQLSRRGGELRCELRGERVGIGGEVVEYLRGEINVG
jgi:PhzF family phenazine biosynthesis protein